MITHPDRMETKSDNFDRGRGWKNDAQKSMKAQNFLWSRTYKAERDLKDKAVIYGGFGTYYLKLNNPEIAYQ